MARKLLLIGWDAADWKTIHRLVDQGDMPILRGLMERGTRGNLNTQQPETLSMRRTGISAAEGPLDL
ncbi:hypothetical protein [uncultured Thiohalocapsa sp.]|uniref:hypothetical protein n=1 Tax=uncultured Thiohalocapsa sp. TaxID=768990 RepID=UPI0025CFBE7A|nr:hypothetical protein [uncultured Thiohalocapsa sp.]